MTDNVIQVNRIRVTGDKICDYRLNDGLNVFKGSNLTGKTTLMWFLDYAFGGQSRNFVEEVQKDCKYIFVDMTINNKYYTVKRGIEKENSKTVCIYGEVTDDLTSLMDKPYIEYSLSEKSSDKQSINEFFLNQLGIQPWKIAFNSKKAGDISWRQLMTFIYIPQTNWDFESALENQPLARRAVFEIFMGIDNKGLQEKQVRVIQLKQVLGELNTKLNSINQLLSEAERVKGSEKRINELKAQISELEGRKRKIQEALELNSESNTLISSKQSLELVLEEQTFKRTDLQNKLADLEMLYSENELNLDKNRVLLKAKKIFSELPITKCPKCFNDLPNNDTGEKCPVCQQEYKNSDAESDYGQNLFLLMDDQKELTILISGLKIEIDALNSEIEQNKNRIGEINEKIFQMNKERIAPILKESGSVDVFLNQANRDLGQSEHANLLLNEENLTKSKIKNTIAECRKLEDEIKSLSTDASSSAAVKERFLEILRYILRDILHSEEEVVDLDEDYLPTFKVNLSRNDVEKSKVVKRILGYYTSVLEYGLRYGSVHPKLLLLDTPRQAELDFTIFRNIIGYWDNLGKYGKPYQIIITGSEFPPETKLIAEFHNPKESGDTSKPAKFVVN